MPTLFPFKNRFISSGSPKLSSTRSIHKTTHHRRAIAWMLLVVFFVTFLPLKPFEGNYGVASADGQTVLSQPIVTITNRYVNFQPAEKEILVQDPSFSGVGKSDHRMTLIDGDAGLNNVPPNQLQVEGQFAQAKLQGGLIALSNLQQVMVSYLQAPENFRESIMYDNLYEGVPRITSVTTTTVNDGQKIIANVEAGQAEAFANGALNVQVGGVNAMVTTPATDDTLGPNQIGIIAVGVQPGLQNITVTRSIDSNSPLALTNNNSLRNIYVYRNAVRIISQLNLDGISLFPNVGVAGSLLRFTRTQQIPQAYDVYFVTDENDQSQYINANKATYFSGPTLPTANNPSEYTVRVPGRLPGSYRVVLTMPGSLDARYVMPGRFRIITVDNPPVIDGFNPLEASAAQPVEVTITGGNWTRLDIPGLEDFEIQNLTLSPFNQQELVITYEGEGAFNFGETDSGSTESAAITALTRRIRVVINQQLNILDLTHMPSQSDQNPDQLVPGQARDNTLRVITRDVEITQNTQVPVTLEILTTIKLEGRPDLVLEQVVSATNQFTYIPSTELPQFTEIVPRVIPIQPGEGQGAYIDGEIDELMVVIKGGNFLVTRYQEGGIEKISYPKIRIGNTVINPNENALPTEYQPDRFQVLRGSTLVNGTRNNELGDTMVFYLPTGAEGIMFNNISDRTLGIVNPRRETNQFPPAFTVFPDAVVFDQINTNDFPSITTVIPNLISLEGGVPVRIIGANFRPGAIVYIEGRSVGNITISEGNTRIDFTAPPGLRNGETQLQVINPEGGIATYPFTYTTTFTDPVLNQVAPAEGTENTLVTLRGNNFLQPDPTVRVSDLTNIDAFIMNRIIGTRVFMGGQDINTYNMLGNRITLTPYHEGASPTRVLQDHVFVTSPVSGQLALGEGFDSVIFHDSASNKFYRLVRDVQGRYFLEDGLGLRYQIRSTTSGTFEAVSGTAVSPVTQNTKGIIGVNGKTLRAYTPYRVEPVETNGTTYDSITGNRARYMDVGTMHIQVPNMSNTPWAGAGLYDVAVVNPDTKEAVLHNAFYYYPEPRITPAVKDIIPELGPEAGGNLITLVLDDLPGLQTGFIDTGTSKTKVFIGVQQVPAADVQVSPNGREIRLKVPPYYENIRDKGTDRVTVPLVLVNPDGGTFHVNYDRPITVERTRRTETGTTTEQVELFGYTYVVPTSNPRVDKLTPARGSAAGRYIVEIFGFDFRDFRNLRDENGNVVAALKADPDHKSPSLYNDQYEVLLDDLYPQVFFGTREAEIVEFSPTYLQVVVGPGEGTVPVYIVNNDSGISNTLNFTFDGSAPRITSLNPNQGDRRGGTLVEILGQDLEQSLVTLMEETYENNSESGLSQRLNQPLTLVRVGQRTNRNLPREHPNAGVINSGRATVTLEGGVTARYNGTAPGSLTVEIVDRNITYRHEYRGFADGEEIFVDTTQLRSNDGQPYPYRELIRFKIDDRRMIVEGGYAPEVDHRSPRHLVANMPAYFTTGTVGLSVINPDGGTANANFTYITPDSRPVITNITREGRDPFTDERDGYGEIRIQPLSYRGGNVISIFGTDFRPDARITIGDVVNLAPANITYNLPNRLTFTMPSLPENTVGNLYRVVVTNADGGSATSDRAEPTPLYIEIIKGESNPRLDTISPNEGPVTGGTRVTLTGNDFRSVMEGFEENKLNTFFGESRVEEGTGLEYVDFSQIIVTVPASDQVGTVNVRVENPDGELSLPPGQFRYISQPNIATMDPARIFANDANTEITVTGEMFQNGARVILGGRLVAAGSEPAAETNHGTGIRGVDENGANRRFSVVGGVAASNVAVANENLMTLRFPEALDLPNNDLIILNPDGGLSDPYADFDYAIPVPDKPLVLEAVPGAEGSVMLIWSKSAPEVLNAAERFEVYGKRSNENQYTFIGDTEDAQFLVRGLLLDTRYDFMVRALNRYGSAIEFAEASARTLSARQDPKLSEKIEELDRQQEVLETQGKEEVAGHRVIRTLGSREIPSGTTPYVIDFSAAKYSRQNEFVVAFPVAALSSMTRSVRITDGKGSLTITPSHLLTREVSSLTAAQRSDAMVQVVFKRLEGAEATGLVSAVTRTQSRASAPYSVAFNLQAGRTSQHLARLMGNAALTINHDTVLYPNASGTSLMVYDPSSHRFNSVGSTATFRDPGIYMLLGTR